MKKKTQVPTFNKNKTNIVAVSVSADVFLINSIM